MAETKTIEVLARTGYGARGVVYALVGGLALLAALGSGGQTGGSRSALATLIDEPLGWVWLALIAAGLLGFAVWRIVEAVTDADHRGNTLKGYASRAAHVVSGIIYGGLAVFSASLAVGASRAGGGEDRAARDWTAWLLAQPFGRWLVAAIAVAIVATGFMFLRKAWRGDVTDRLTLPERGRDSVITLGRLGFAARGVVFLIVGGFVASAAWRARSADVQGLGGALETLQAQPYGWVLLALTAIGLFAFGIFGIVQARYRHIDAPDMADAQRAAGKMSRSLS